MRYNNLSIHGLVKGIGHKEISPSTEPSKHLKNNKTNPEKHPFISLNSFKPKLNYLKPLMNLKTSKITLKQAFLNQPFKHSKSNKTTQKGLSISLKPPEPKPNYLKKPYNP